MRSIYSGTADDLRTVEVLHAIEDARGTLRPSRRASMASTVYETLTSVTAWLIAACILLLTL